MKKIVLLIVILLTLMLLSQKEYDLTKDTIRFRIIANSNNSRDILMKELVVNEISDLVFKKEEDIDNARKDIILSIENVERRIDSIFKDNNYNMNYVINYGLNEFPKKEYNGVTYDAGLYESMVIELGEAKGDNYWCILYPPLCMVDDEINEKVEYKSRIVEFFKDLF